MGKPHSSPGYSRRCRTATLCSAERVTSLPPSMPHEARMYCSVVASSLTLLLFGPSLPLQVSIQLLNRPVDPASKRMDRAWKGKKHRWPTGAACPSRATTFRLTASILTQCL
ncbi:hypothetical protein BU16DRAFT_133153 [Lophium mytilinum]|uniref:Uncharacterized protein n=1 Tax=Lophium mytilinum TaxID=390894 RepID=A0A6A6QEA9_9PEZI|nr:hypothetical protein BU16DRAFT_133153 [Lophium mytilinum]